MQKDQDGKMRKVKVAEFGKRLRELRKEKGMTQLQLGAQLNVTKMGISHWERGDSQPDLDQLKRIAEYFEVTTDYLLGKD